MIIILTIIIFYNNNESKSSKTNDKKFESKTSEDGVMTAVSNPLDNIVINPLEKSNYGDNQLYCILLSTLSYYTLSFISLFMPHQVMRSYTGKSTRSSTGKPT